MNILLICLGNENDIKQLIMNGVDLNLADERGHSPLILTIFKGKLFEKQLYSKKNY